MKRLILLASIWTFASLVLAQPHVRQAVDDMATHHPEWIVNYVKNESTSPKKSGTQTNRIYQLSMTDAAAIDTLLNAFDTDKMVGYNYIRTSADYNRAAKKRQRQTVTLQNGERLESHSTEYSLVSLTVVDPEHDNYRTNYILKWYPPKDGRVEAKLYILNGPRPNNQ